MSVKTVWRATTAEQSKKDRVASAKVVVVSSMPETRTEPVLFEIHAPETALEPTATEGEFLFDWHDLDKFPYQVSHG